MAIQDQIDRLNAEVEEQAALIAEISDILATKAGGSGGSAAVETCTVNISFTANVGYMYLLTYHTTSGIVTECAGQQKAEYVLENVLCGSCVSFLYGKVWGFDSQASSNIEVVASYFESPISMLGRYVALRAPETAGSVGTFTITDED